MMTDEQRLKDALQREEEAVRLYRSHAAHAHDERIKEMFEQFAMNESWHAAAIRAKLERKDTS